MPVSRLLSSALIAFLPSPIKIIFLRFLGAKIGRGCYIGFSVVHAHVIEIGDFVRVGHSNLIKELTSLSLETGSKVESFNWLTGASKGSISLGRNSSIRRFHFFEASGDIYIGSNTIIAGRSSLFFTHRIAPNNLNDVRPTEIGDWCYIGAATRFLPGASVAEGTFVGMRAVVSKKHTGKYCRIVGCPAKTKKFFDNRMAYFDRPFLRHAHHPLDYVG